MGWNYLRELVTSVEIESDSESPDVASFTNENSRATLVLKIVPTGTSGANLLGPVYAILGASNYSNSTATNMVRELPLQHPMFGWLFATEIASMQGRGQINLVKADGNLGSSPPPWQAYDHYRLVVVFTSVKYAVKREESLNESELYRFVERHFQLGLENIIRPGNSFRWVPGSPNAGQTIPFGFVARARKGVVTYIWKNVTRFGLFGRYGDDWPRNIWNGVGKVNESTFDGCPPGQLLLLPPKFVPQSTPFSTEFGGGAQGTVFPGGADLNLAYDIEFPMSFISPPLDPAFDYSIEPRYKRNGHNLFPPPPGATTHYWYPATQSGAAAGTPLYEAYDFKKLFRLMGPND